MGKERGRTSLYTHFSTALAARSRPTELGNLKGISYPPPPGLAWSAAPPPRPTPPASLGSASGPEAPSPSVSPTSLVSTPSQSLSLLWSGKPLSALFLLIQLRPGSSVHSQSSRPAPPRIHPGPAPAPPPGHAPYRTAGGGLEAAAPLPGPAPSPRKPLPGPSPAPRSFLGPGRPAGQKTASRRPAARRWSKRSPRNAGSSKRRSRRTSQTRHGGREYKGGETSWSTDCRQGWLDQEEQWGASEFVERPLLASLPSPAAGLRE